MTPERLEKIRAMIAKAQESGDGIEAQIFMIGSVDIAAELYVDNVKLREVIQSIITALELAEEIEQKNHWERTAMLLRKALTE